MKLVVRICYCFKAYQYLQKIKYFFQISFDGNGVAEDVKLHGHTGEPKVVFLCSL